MPESLRQAAVVGMDEAERVDLVNLLAADPEAGVSLGGGLRKLRVARTGGGKSGGYRVLHFYRADDMPLFLLTVFAKNEQATLSAREKKDLLEICDGLADDYRRR